MPNLTEAVQLIQQKQFTQAQKILEPILKAEPKNIQAWFWYVETWPSLEKRIKTLEVCLQINPGQMQVSQALQALRTKQMKEAPTAPPPQPVPPAPAARPAPMMDMEPPDWAKPAATTPTPAPAQPAVSVDLPEWLKPASSQPEPKAAPKPKYQSTSAFSYDEEPQPQEAEVSHPSWLQPRGESRPAFNWDEIEGASAHEPEPAAAVVNVPAIADRETEPNAEENSYPFHKVWLIALSMLNMDAYRDTLNDRDATIGRVIEWMVYAGALTGLLATFGSLFNPQMKELLDMPQLKQFFVRFNLVFVLLIIGLVTAVLASIGSVLNLLIFALIQNFLAVAFGGKGTYRRTVYAIGAYQAPLAFLTALVAFIPYINFLSFPLAIYGFVLDVRALIASHSLSTGKAIGVMLTPTLIGFCLLCVMLVLFAPSLATSR